MDHDERYLYFAIEYDDLKESSLDTLIFIDTIKEHGISTNPFNKNIVVDGTDYLIHLTENGLSRILKSEDSKEEKSEFIPIDIKLNEEIIHYRTGQKLPSMSYDTGILKEGNGNPDSKYYDSLTDYNLSKQNNLIELRIPWSLLGFVDPSTKKITDSLKIGGIGVTVAAYDSNLQEEYSILPESNTIEERSYTWENWDKGIKVERLKSSYMIIKDMFSKY